MINTAELFNILIPILMGIIALIGGALITVLLRIYNKLESHSERIVKLEYKVQTT